MAISKATADLELGKFKESSSVSGQPGVVVVNPDGSSIGSGGGGGGASATDTSTFTATTSTFTPTGGEYNSTAQTIASGKQGTFAMDSQRNQFQNLATKLDPVNDGVTTYNFGNPVSVISTATTTTIKTGAGTAVSIRVLGGTLGNVTVYDNTAGSGTVLVPTVTPAAPTILLSEAGFTTGLTIVTAAATLINVTCR